MIKGLSRKKFISKENILDLITDEQIFSFYLGNFKVGQTMLSPFRKEDNPSFYISNRSGRYTFSDLADSRFHGDCFSLISLMYNLSFKDTLIKIASDFGLPLAGIQEKNYEKIVQSLPKKRLIKPPALVEVVDRPFTLKELEYWNRHLQDKSDLRRENIVAIGHAWLNGKLLQTKQEDEMAFGYYFPELDKWKLYYPEREQKQGKWMGSINTGFVEAREQLIGAKKGIIQKSRKDRLVTQKLYPYVCNTQNETRASFNEEFIEFLNKEVNEKFLWFDSDGPGVKNSKIITTELGYSYINCPRYLLAEGINDISGWIYNRGPEEAIQFLHEKGLI